MSSTPFTLFLCLLSLFARSQYPAHLGMAGLGRTQLSINPLVNPASHQSKKMAFFLFTVQDIALPELREHSICLMRSQGRKIYALGIRKDGLDHYQSIFLEAALGLDLEQNWRCGLKISWQNLLIVERKPRNFFSSELHISHIRTKDFSWVQSLYWSSPERNHHLLWNAEISWPGSRSIDLFLGGHMSNFSPSRIALAMELKINKGIQLRQGIYYQGNYGWAFGLGWRGKRWQMQIGFEYQKARGFLASLGNSLKWN